MVYRWEDTDLKVLPHLTARGEGEGYGPVNAQVFHTTITEKYYMYGAEEVCKIMNFVSKMMNFVSKMMNFVL